MIPTMILLGLVLGRWWKVALITAAVGWPLLLAATEVLDFEMRLIGAAALASVNAGVGALVHQVCLYAYRRLHHHDSSVVAG
jgi:hypothetical protein